jgi:hypothetical protein
MRTNKRYTNVTFTKRVDHEATRGQSSRKSAAPTVCKMCGAVYANRRWTAPGTPLKNGKHRGWEPVGYRLCPACKQEERGLPCGYVYLDGGFLAAHWEEVEKLLRNEVARAAENNPLARIMGWQAGDGRLLVTTTTEHLAQRLGHALEKAFHGDVRYSFSHEDKLSRVFWHRD